MPLSDFDFVGEEQTEHPRRPPRRGRAARRAVRRFTLRRQWVSIVVFLLGFMVLLYPAFTQWYYSTGAKQLVVDFDAKQRELDAAAIAARMDLAHAYNDTLDPSRLTDPYTAREEAGRAEYARMLELNELLGHIEVPRIGQDLPVYAGINDAVLNKGAGHLEGTSLPVGGVDTHSVITAHRGLPNARLFTDLDKMQVGYGSSPRRYAFLEFCETVTANGAGNTGRMEVFPHIPVGVAIGETVTLRKAACRMVIVPGSHEPGRARRTVIEGARFRAIQKR